MASIGEILNPLPGVVGAVAKGLDDLFTSDEERLRAQIDMRKIDLEGYRVDAGLLAGQQEINKTEAQHASVFVAGWRPALGWMCVLGLAYQYAAHPLLTWGWVAMQASGWISDALAPPPALDLSELMTLLLGMLGLSINRSWDKHKGVARSTIAAAKDGD